MEKDIDGTKNHVATSNLFIGREWYKADGRDAYSGLRVDIDPGQPITIRLTPLVSCHSKEGWNDYEIEPVRPIGCSEEENEEQPQAKSDLHEAMARPKSI